MTTAVRKQMSINVDVMDLLNEQVKVEQHSSSVYLAMASWCDQNGFVRGAAFFHARSTEERDHMLKIFKFINDNGGSAYSPEVSNINHEYSSLKELFELSLEQEINVSKKIGNIVKVCREVNDFGTENFLQWFVTEQLEEEQMMRDILDMIDLMGDAPLKLIDERIPD